MKIFISSRYGAFQKLPFVILFKYFPPAQRLVPSQLLLRHFTKEMTLPFNVVWRRLSRENNLVKNYVRYCRYSMPMRAKTALPNLLRQNFTKKLR